MDKTFSELCFSTEPDDTQCTRPKWNRTLPAIYVWLFLYYFIVIIIYVFWFTKLSSLLLLFIVYLLFHVRMSAVMLIHVDTSPYQPPSVSPPPVQGATTWPVPTEPWPSSRTSRRSKQPGCWAPRLRTRCTSGTAGAPPSARRHLWTTFRYHAWPESTLTSRQWV